MSFRREWKTLWPIIIPGTFPNIITLCSTESVRSCNGIACGGGRVCCLGDLAWEGNSQCTLHWIMHSVAKSHSLGNKLHKDPHQLPHLIPAAHKLEVRGHSNKATVAIEHDSW